MKIRNYRWFIAVLLFFATVINYMDRQLIGLLKPVLEETFLWTETDFAHIVMAFTTAYALGLLSFGRFIDKAGTKLGYSLAIVVWSVSAMLHAVAKGVFGFASARVVLGIGEAGNFPAGMKAISEWFPKKERGTATGIFNAGTTVGVILALVLTPLILKHWGWQEVFWVTGALGFLWLIFWLIFYDVPSRQKRLSAEELDFIAAGQVSGEEDSPGKRVKVNWIGLFTMPQTWAVIVGKFMIDPIYWFFLFWLPSYFSSSFQLDLTKPSFGLMVIYASATVGCIGGGYFSSWLINRGFPILKARKAALFIFAVMELSVISMQYITSMWAAVALISLAVALQQAWATNVFTMASDMFPRERVSSVVGIAGMSGAVGGILFPVLVGHLLDLYRSQENIVAGYNILFSVCAVSYLVAWVIIHLLTREGKQTG
ncbi:MAG: MFS transporter [Mangrovibacterium sp.]